ncbi:MAG TPA: ferric reductase-like transmembrane domain-containing protein [Candidatus Thermoplasmatota archaeon]|nr:ferric reductase-like transmembrane domain-containing protein [Candidatus Thermoplasmatota archaeon]
MRLTRRRRAALALALVAGPALLLLGPLAAQAQDGVVELDVDNAGCFGHHAAETPPFKTTLLIVPEAIVEVPAGQEFDFPVQVQVAWKQEMRNVKVGLNLSQAPNLEFVDTGTHADFDDAPTGTVNFGETVETPFEVAENATAISVVLHGDQNPLNSVDLDLQVVGGDGESLFNKTVEDNYLNGIQGGEAIADETVELDQSKVVRGGVGTWLARVTFPGDGPPQVPATYTLTIHVGYQRTDESFLPVADLMPAGALANVTFRLRATSAGPATIGLRSLGWAHYTHTDAQATDDGNFSKTDPPKALTVGSTLRVQAGGPAIGGVVLDPASRLMRQWGFLLGWLGFFLVPPSLLLGGTFGGRTVRALNKFAGSARQRVLWHNALSYVLLSVGLTHMTLFLLEVTYNWTIGIVWGSLTLASIIGLGLTGALQNRIAKSWGYATWRFTHFLLGMLVVVFITLHVVVDGVDLQFLRDYFLTA